MKQFDGSAVTRNVRSLGVKFKNFVSCESKLNIHIKLKIAAKISY